MQPVPSPQWCATDNWHSRLFKDTWIRFSIPQPSVNEHICSVANQEQKASHTLILKPANLLYKACKKLFTTKVKLRWFSTSVKSPRLPGFCHKSYEGPEPPLTWDRFHCKGSHVPIIPRKRKWSPACAQSQWALPALPHPYAEMNSLSPPSNDFAVSSDNILSQYPAGILPWACNEAKILNEVVRWWGKEVSLWLSVKMRQSECDPASCCNPDMSLHGVKWLQRCSYTAGRKFGSHGKELPWKEWQGSHVLSEDQFVHT